MPMAYRVDIVLADGTRRRGFVDLTCPDIIKSANFAFHSDDKVLEDATIITGEQSVYCALKENGFRVAEPNSGSSVFTVRLRAELARHITKVSNTSGISAASVISSAVEFWVENGTPLKGEKR